MIDWQFATMLSMLGQMFSKPGARVPKLSEWSLYERSHIKTAEEIAEDVKRSFGVGD